MAIVGNLSLKNLFKKGQAMAKAVEAKVVQESGGIKTHTGGRAVNALRSNLHGTPKSHLTQVPHVQPVAGFKLKSNAWTRSKPAKKIRRGIYDLGQLKERIQFGRERRKMLGIAEHLGVEIHKTFQPGEYPDYYHPNFNHIYVTDPKLKDTKGLVIFAHELGHAIQRKTNPEYFHQLEEQTMRTSRLLESKISRAVSKIEEEIGEEISPAHKMEVRGSILEKPIIDPLQGRNFTQAQQSIYRHEADAWAVAEKEFPRLTKHKWFKKLKQIGLSSYIEGRDFLHPNNSAQLKLENLEDLGLSSLSEAHYNRAIQKGNNWFDKHMTNSRDNWGD